MTFRKRKEMLGNFRKRQEMREETSGNSWSFLKSPKLYFLAKKVKNPTSFVLDLKYRSRFPTGNS